MKLHPSWLVLFLAIAIIAGDIFLQVFHPDFFIAENTKSVIGKPVLLSGKISKDPDENENKVNLKLTNLELLNAAAPALETPEASAYQNSENSGASEASAYNNSETNSQSIIKLGGSVFVQLISPEVKLERGDKITLSGELSDGFGTYTASLFRPEIKSLEKSNNLFLRFRNFFAAKVQENLPELESGLGLGYLLGQKSGVDKTFQETLQVVGLTHIIVASGAHLGILTSAARRIFGKISRFASLLSALILIVLFVCVTGLSASMLRAALVAGLGLILWYYGRTINPLRLIILVAAATLLYNPAYLTDLAWLLSFASFTGILVLAPELTSFFYGKDQKPGFIGSTLISSASATFLCAPILLYFYGSISLISLFANLLILPTISLAMGLTFLTGAFAILATPLASAAAPLAKIATFLTKIPAFLAKIALDYQITIVNFLGEKTQFLITVSPNNPAVFLLYLLLIPCIIYICISKRKKKQLNTVALSALD